jgi:hypothetical protein
MGYLAAHAAEVVHLKKQNAVKAALAPAAGAGKGKGNIPTGFQEMSKKVLKKLKGEQRAAKKGGRGKGGGGGKKELPVDRNPLVTRTAKTTREGKPICKQFNDKRGCQRTNCNFVHVCDAVKDSGEVCQNKGHNRLSHR